MPSPKPSFLGDRGRMVSSEPLLDAARSPVSPTSHTFEASYPSDEEDLATPQRHMLSRRQSMRSIDADLTDASEVHRRRYTLAGIFLILSLVSFVIQTETAVSIQTKHGWKKPFAMLYFTHSSWAVLGPLQLIIIRFQKRHLSWQQFSDSHINNLKTSARMVISGRNHLTHNDIMMDPIKPMFRRVAFITTALTIAGSSWYVAVNMTTPSDLTAIYNCSAFFAYVFSIPLLHEKLRKWKIVSVIVAIGGVLIVAYGDGKSGETDISSKRRTLGNLVIGVGSVLYGFYEVLYKKLGCPPEGASPGRSVIFANAMATGIGLFTLLVMWVGLAALHILGIEEFELPRGEAAYLLIISVTANVVFSGSFLVLISLTSPVLSSVAALLTIFLVAITDWMLTGVPISFAGMVGGLLIIAAFLALAWDSWVELEEGKKEEDIESSEEGDDY